MTALPSFLTDPLPRLLLFGGKGGVGKTSSAAATALELARKHPEASFRLISTDPAHSLADCLGRLELPANLQVTELDAQECLTAFKRQHGAKLYEIALRGTFLDHDDISRFLVLSLPGLDELMAALEIVGWVASGHYRTIIVDTAPTGHTLRLLAMPALIKQWLGALDALLAKHRYMRQVYGGRTARDEVDGLLDELATSVREMEALLRDPVRTRFVPVMLAEEMSLRETLSLLRELKRSQIRVQEIVVNRLVPANECPSCRDARRRQIRILQHVVGPGGWEQYAFWGVPLYAEEVRGAAGLARFWPGGMNLAAAPADVPGKSAGLGRRCVHETGLRLPTGESLLLFAGKGGVGKTTLACATSLRLAQETPAREVLLCSTDPAHSLADCLDRPVGAAPKRICPGLSAVEINAEAEFESFKEAYRKELRAFLRSAVPDVDLAMDEQAMERILDLAPPGLDEVMGLLRVMELCEENDYDVLVIDTAPTGHLVRLLEMPEVIDQWLKAFFGVFLKYEKIFRLPKITQRLVEISKALKHLRAVLADPARSALFGVTILTEMALAETRDLLAACRRLEIHAPVLLLNQATPPGECKLCEALRQREADVEEAIRRSFPTLARVVIYRSGEPRGLELLRELGRALYRAPVLNHVSYA